jgi:hypothetical protein
MRPDANPPGAIGRALLTLALALPAACLIPGHASAEGQSTTADALLHQAPRHHNRSSLDDRVRVLSQALDLDATQQSELKKVLEGQRAQVKKIWSDSSVPAAYRVSATQAISDKTSDQIKALLNDEQKKKYNPPRQPHDAPAGADRPNVEAWMNPGKAK